VDYTTRIESLQSFLDYWREDGQVFWSSHREPQGFWWELPADVGDPENIYLGKDFDEAYKVLEERHEAYVDAYWGDTFKK